MATLAPSAARRFAMAAPMPRDPPVTSAIFPSSFLVIVFLLLLESRSLLLLRLTASLDVAVPRWQHTLLSWHRCLAGIGAEMELRHLRYFVAIAEAGSMTVAAGRKLHTSQPSLSRQIRDLEEDVGAQLLTRRARGADLPRPCSPGAVASRRGRRSGPPGRESQQAMFHHGIFDRTRINVDARSLADPARRTA